MSRCVSCGHVIITRLSVTVKCFWLTCLSTGKYSASTRSYKVDMKIHLSRPILSFYSLDFKLDLGVIQRIRKQCVVDFSTWASCHLICHLFLFLQMPTLMKATADDEAPCPGYLFEEISSILFPALLKSSVYIHCFQLPDKTLNL